MNELLKCLTLTPPWGTLVMLGAKRNETRSWSTSYRGLLGIHAAAGFPKWARDLCWNPPFSRVLAQAGYWRLNDIPTAALIGTVQLVDCVRVERVRYSISLDELAFGDYSDGRYAWILEDPHLLPAPVPMRGMLGLWTTSMEVLSQRTGAPL